MKAVQRSLSSVVGMPRSATMSPLPSSAFARNSAEFCRTRVLSPATHAILRAGVGQARDLSPPGYTPFFFTCATCCVSDADSNGKLTSALILLTVTRTCSFGWLSQASRPRSSR